MKLVRQPCANKSNVRDNALIPLINVVFLMLIFFMVVGQLAPPAAFEVKPPRARLGDGSPADGWTLAVSTGGQLALNGTPLSLEQLLARLRQVRDQRHLPELSIKADAKLAAGQLRALLNRLRVAGVEQVRLVTLPPR